MGIGRPSLSLIHNISDALIWLSYIAIPVVLVYFVRRRSDMPFPWIFWLFGAFIVLCGTTHLMEVVMFYWPVYRLAGLIKLATAIVSVSTVIALVPITPVALSMRSPKELEREIADRNRAEAALRESEERFRGTFENAAVGVAHGDADGRLLRVNERLCDIIGYSREELLARTFQDVTHPDDLAFNVELYMTLMRGESLSFSLEKRYIRKDGSLVWVNVSVSLQRDAAGKPAYAIALIQDISERKQAEEALRLANARLDLAVRGSNIGIWEFDMPDGAVERSRAHFFNVWEQLNLDRPESPPGFAAVMALVHPDDRERLEQSIRAYLSGETSEFEVEHRARRKDGSYRWMLARGVAMRDPAGSPHSVHRQQHRHHRPPARRGGAARERGAVPRHLRERGRRHRPQRCPRPMAARQREILRDRRLHPRRAAPEDLPGNHASRGLGGRTRKVHPTHARRTAPATRWRNATSARMARRSGST